MVSKEELSADMVTMLSDLLGVEPEELSPAARFKRDLGGESIDMLDLAFRVKQKYGVDVKFETMLGGDEMTIDENGAVSPEALEQLQARFPFLDIASVRDNPKADRLEDLLTVGAITEFIYLTVQRGTVRMA